GLVQGHELVAPLRVYPPPAMDEAEARESGEILSMPVDAIAETMAQTICELCDEHGARPALAGVGFPGIIRNGVVEDSPNLKQAKGAKMAEMLSAALSAHGLNMAVSLYNDADVMAAGMAATRGQLEKLIRVWTLGNGVGFGRYPHAEGIWEGGHVVVTLDPKEAFCGCGGKGHLEGIMGHRAMRLRFLDLEPEEVFANAKAGDPRCCEFELMWHRALAAASATSIHLEGPGKFFISGPNSRFVKVSLLSQYLHEMVTMSPLQGSVFEVVPTSKEIAVIGAATNASLAAR
ncbi:MAG TPA: ROK family protein, partial [Bryobacteraceae bacterium]|nr:ROK family protein [Bryobacteraceae bacterium]